MQQQQSIYMSMLIDSASFVCLTTTFLATGGLSNYFTQFYDFSMIIHVFSNSMIYPCMELFLVIFQVFHEIQSLWEPCC